MAVSPGFPGGKRQEGLLPEALEGARPCRHLTSELECEEHALDV